MIFNPYHLTFTSKTSNNHTPMKHLYLTICAVLCAFVSFAVAPITGPDSACTGNTIIFSDATTGGTWSTTGSIATIDPATGVTNCLSSGTTIIEYTFGGTSVYHLLTINTTPGPISGKTALCTFSTTYLSDAIPGGKWYSSNPDTIFVDSVTGYTAGAFRASAVITYKLSTGCFVTTPFHTDTMPASISGYPYVCTDSSVTLSDASPGGIWTSTSTIGTISPAGVLSGIAPGTDTIRYTMPGSSCPAVMYVTVSAPPPAITGVATICPGYYITLSDAVTGGEWSTTDTGIVYASTYTGDIFGKVVGTANITYSLYTGCTISTVVTSAPAPAPISGVMSACVGTTTTLSDAGGGTWSSSDPTVASVSSAGIVTGLVGGFADITYTSTDGCGVDGIFLVYTVSPPAKLSATTHNVCPGNSFIISADITGGTWSSSNANASVTSGMVSGSLPGIDTVYYTLTDMCGDTSTPFVVTVLTTEECHSLNVAAATNSTPSLQVYPNPADGAFTINFTSAKDEAVKVVITNVVGATVKELTTKTNKQTEVSLAQPQGMYFITATTATGSNTAKIIVR